MEPGNLQEIEGVLNPAAARGPDGGLYLFPRLVGRGSHEPPAEPEAWIVNRSKRSSVGPLTSGL